MAYHGISQDLFHNIYTREDVSFKKPHPEMGSLIFDLLKENNYNKKDYLMVGDSEVDSTFARKLGIKCLIVKF